MNFIAAAISSFDWQGIWQVTQRTSGAALAFLSGLPRDCKLASLHAAAVCMDQTPQYHTVPGFAPLAVSWGWLVLGFTAGACAMLICLLITGKLHKQPTLVQLGTLMETAPAVPTQTQQQARADALRYIALGGQPALRELATASRMSESAFLAHITGASSTQSTTIFQ